jgi:hypothetical protein
MGQRIKATPPTATLITESNSAVDDHHAVSCERLRRQGRRIPPFMRVDPTRAITHLCGKEPRVSWK